MTLGIKAEAKNRFIPHAIIKVKGTTRHTAKGEKYWCVERGTYVFQYAFFDQGRAEELAQRINGGGVRINPDNWSTKMPKEIM